MILLSYEIKHKWFCKFSLPGTKCMVYMYVFDI